MNTKYMKVVLNTPQIALHFNCIVCPCDE